MKKNDGFIATSLIYSFFLVFIAVIMALINNYIANKTILERYNETVMENLNTEKYWLKVYSKNATITGGKNYINLVKNGDFSGGTAEWYGAGTNSSFSIVSGELRRNYVSTGYVYQDISSGIVNNHQYYLAISYRQPGHVYRVRSYVESSKFIATSQNSVKSKLSTIFTSTGNNRLYLGYYTSNMGSYQTFIDDVMLIDLTNAYSGTGIPTSEWLDNNLDWFDGTVSFIKIDWKSGDNPLEVSMSKFNANDKMNITCKDEGNRSVSFTKDEANSKFTINSLSSNVTCNVDWRE